MPCSQNVFKCDQQAWLEVQRAKLSLFPPSFTTKTCRQSGLKTKYTGERKKNPKGQKPVKSLLKLTLESLTGRSLECSVVD